MAQHDRYISPFSTRYASDEMQYIFSDDNKFRTWRRLWVALARAEMEQGLTNITPDMVAELEAHVDDINYEVAIEREKLVRHDVMSHVYAYGQQCGDAHQLRCDAVEVAEVFGQPLVRAQMVAQIGRETAQLVHRSVGFDPLVDLRHALAADERRRSLVSCFRIYFRHNLKCCFGNVPLKSSR